MATVPQHIGLLNQFLSQERALKRTEDEKRNVNLAIQKTSQIFKDTNDPNEAYYRSMEEAAGLGVAPQVTGFVAATAQRKAMQQTGLELQDYAKKNFDIDVSPTVALKLGDVIAMHRNATMGVNTTNQQGQQVMRFFNALTGKESKDPIVLDPTTTQQRAQAARSQKLFEHGLDVRLERIRTQGDFDLALLKGRLKNQSNEVKYTELERIRKNAFIEMAGYANNFFAKFRDQMDLPGDTKRYVDPMTGQPAKGINLTSDILRNLQNKERVDKMSEEFDDKTVSFTFLDKEYFTPSKMQGETLRFLQNNQINRAAYTGLNDIVGGKSAAFRERLTSNAITNQEFAATDKIIRSAINQKYTGSSPADAQNFSRQVREFIAMKRGLPRLRYTAIKEADWDALSQEDKLAFYTQLHRGKETEITRRR